MRFKKRRKPGPSKNEKKIARRAQEGTGPTGPALRSLFPGISGLSIGFSITSPQGETVEEGTRSYSPDDPVTLTFPCRGTCGVGKFSLQEKVAGMVEAHEEEGEASGACQEEGFGGVPEPCGYILTCRLKIAYT